MDVDESPINVVLRTTHTITQRKGKQNLTPLQPWLLPWLLLLHFWAAPHYTS